ncbi:Kinetochore protein Spc24 [Heracleum sosnowskyi]|uniref:Kinetochore protein Spc24 n=1 Tax=Heracleum sosnowskyi TaxID=360622 RepID=A0AAD8N839_9APIA|nr:Kinetochore protein Spc24 [Heracleum sosnowskyi]
MSLIGRLSFDYVNTLITSDIDDLEHQRVSIEERRESLRKLEKQDLRAQMKLSMYASVTNVIPKLDEQQSAISGHIVEREKKVVQNFEFDPLKMSPYDTCNRMWKMINL